MIRKLKFIVTNIYMQLIAALQWRHNEHGGISNHQPYECLLNRLFKRRSNEIPKLRVTGLCAGNSPVIHWWLVNYPHWGPVAWKMFPFDDVIMQRYIEMKWNNHRDDPFLQCIQLLHSLRKMYSEDIYARGTETPILVHDAGVGSNAEHWNVTERWNSKGSKHRKFTIPIAQKRPCSMQILLNIFVISLSGSSRNLYHTWTQQCTKLMTTVW